MFIFGVKELLYWRCEGVYDFELFKLYFLWIAWNFT